MPTVVVKERTQLRLELGAKDCSTAPRCSVFRELLPQQSLLVDLVKWRLELLQYWLARGLVSQGKPPTWRGSPAEWNREIVDDPERSEGRRRKIRR